MSTSRLLSIDVFRGATVIAMIIVNNPGSWDHVYAPLLHAHWHGCTPTDLIFPFFLFIVGVSIHFAYKHKRSDGLTRNHFLKISKRSAIIFGLGLLMAWYTFPLSRMIYVERLSTLRIPGVLQRISIVFFCCSILYFRFGWLGQLRITALLLFAYYILMNWIPLPDGSAPNLEPGTNLAAWSDRWLLDGHLWSQSKTWDPEGVLSTLPAVATGLIGILTGHLFDAVENPAERVTWLFLSGSLLIVSGLFWDLSFPMNKSLWTSSYVLYSGGLAIQIWAGCHWLIDVNEYQSWINPFLYFGTNAIFAFVASGILAKTLIRWTVADEAGAGQSIWNYLFQHVYLSWLEPKPASLLFALSLVGLFWLGLRWMYRRKIFVKV
jgi:predicted acyltransferase